VGVGIVHHRRIEKLNQGRNSDCGRGSAGEATSLGGTVRNQGKEGRVPAPGREDEGGVERRGTKGVEGGKDARLPKGFVTSKRGKDLDRRKARNGGKGRAGLLGEAVLLRCKEKKEKDTTGWGSRDQKKNGCRKNGGEESFLGDNGAWDLLGKSTTPPRSRKIRGDFVGLQASGSKSKKKGEKNGDCHGTLGTKVLGRYQGK